MTSSTARANAKRRVSLVIATPAYGATVATGYVGSLLETCGLLEGRGIAVNWFTIGNDSLVQRARSCLVARFLAIPDASHLLLIDSDIVWRAADVLRMIGHDKEVCCGVYRMKSDELQFTSGPLFRADGSVSICPQTGCVELELAATGFMLIKRQVFTKWIAAYPQSRIRKMDGVEPDVLAWLADYFPVFVDERGRLLSEDYGHSRRWRDIGGRIWADPDVLLTHVGRKDYTGALRSHMRSTPEEEAA